MKNISLNQSKVAQRRNRVKGKISRGDSMERPRLSVFKSNKHIFVQLIDDLKSKTLVSANDKEIKEKNLKQVEIANNIGKLIAQKSLEKKVKDVRFDRGRYAYHGIVKAIAEGAREGGLNF